MFKIRYFVLILAVVIAFGISPSVGVYAGTPTATPRPTVTPKPSRTPRPTTTPRPTATLTRTPTLAPTLPSDPVMALTEPQSIELLTPTDKRIFVEGTITLQYPDGWEAMADPWGSVIVASDMPTLIIALIQGPKIETHRVSGDIYFFVPEQLPQMSLSKSAKPISLLNRFFDVGRQYLDIRESKPSPESFTIGGKEGVATVYHCRHCSGYEYYMVVVKASNGFTFASFTMKDLTIERFRNTFRAVVASVEFARS